MGWRYKSSYCNSLKSKYISKIEEKKRQIEKNFRDMDFENANIRENFEQLKNNMIKECNNLIAEINQFYFY